MPRPDVVEHFCKLLVRRQRRSGLPFGGNEPLRQDAGKMGQENPADRGRQHGQRGADADIHGDEVVALLDRDHRRTRRSPDRGRHGLID